MSSSVISNIDSDMIGFFVVITRVEVYVVWISVKGKDYTNCYFTQEAL